MRLGAVCERGDGFGAYPSKIFPTPPRNVNKHLLLVRYMSSRQVRFKPPSPDRLFGYANSLLLVRTLLLLHLSCSYLHHPTLWLRGHSLRDQVMTQIYIGMVLRNGQCGKKTASPPRLIKSGCLLHGGSRVFAFSCKFCKHLPNQQMIDIC